MWISLVSGGGGDQRYPSWFPVGLSLRGGGLGMDGFWFRGFSEAVGEIRRDD